MNVFVNESTGYSTHRRTILHLTIKSFHLQANGILFLGQVYVAHTQDARGVCMRTIANPNNIQFESAASKSEVAVNILISLFFLSIINMYDI